MLQAQESSLKETKKEAKERARREKKAFEKMIYEKAVMAIDSSEFILEADMIYLKKGDSFPVSSNINFISVYGDKAVVQIASTSSSRGLNQMGGITVEGNIRNKKITKDDKGIIRLNMDVSGIAISAQVEITLYGNTNRAEATVFPNFNSRRITLKGAIIPLAESNIYKSGFSY